MDGGLGARGPRYPRWFVDGVDFGIPTAAEEPLWLGMAKRPGPQPVAQLAPTARMKFSPITFRMVASEWRRRTIASVRSKSRLG